MAVVDKIEDGKPLLFTSKASRQAHPGKRVAATPAKRVGCYQAGIQKCFLSDRNPEFARNAEHALRGAIFVLILGLPFLIPSGSSASVDFFMGRSMFKSSVVIFFMLNMGMNLGETLSKCIMGLRGAVVALLMMWGIAMVFPDGVLEDSSPDVFWIGAVMGAFFLFIMVTLNFGMSTRIFAISNFVGWWMSFLKPGKHNFHCPWTEMFDPYQDSGIDYLMTVVVGTTLAIMGTFLPYPLLALDTAKDHSKELSEHILVSWERLVEYFSTEQRNPYMEDQVHSNLSRLRMLYGTLSANIEISWWECFGLGCRHRVRRKLRRLQGALQDGYDHLFSMWSISQASEFTEEQQQLMQKVKPSLLRVIRSCRAVMQLCVACVCEGAMQDDQEVKILDLVKEVHAAEAALCRKFIDTRRALNKSPSTAFLSSGTNENSEFIHSVGIAHTVAFSVSGYARGVCEFANELVQSRNNRDVLPLADVGQCIMSPFKDIMETEHMTFAIRAFVTVVTAFLIGYRGYSDLIQPYNASIASTAAVMLTSFNGSALVRNTGRLQGIVLGMIAGQIVHHCFGSCHWWNVAGLMVAVFTYALCTIYIKATATPAIAYVGTLAAIFGLQEMLAGRCESGSEHLALNKEGTYNQIIHNMVASSLILFFDFVFSQPRASLKAHESLTQAFKEMDMTLAYHFDKDVKRVATKRGHILHALMEAEDRGQEAVLEPRLWRTSWKHSLFDEVLHICRHLRNDVRGVECCMAEGFMAGGQKNRVLVALLRTEAFPRIGNLLRGKVNVIRNLCDLFLHETVAPFPRLSDPDVLRQFSQEEEQALADLVEEMKKLVVLKQLPTDSISQDPLCQICVAVACIQAMFFDLGHIQHLIFREG